VGKCNINVINKKHLKAKKFAIADNYHRFLGIFIFKFEFQLN